MAADLAGNLLISVLREQDMNRLTPHMRVFEMRGGDILQKAGDVVHDTWFPCGAALAGFCVEMDEGSQIDVAVVGREGAIGGIVSNGDVPAFATAKVRFPGRFLRIKTAALEMAKVESLPMRHWFARYSDCLFAQVFQSSACNASHSTLQRAAKWLLAGMDRTSGTEIEMTQEQFAEMLGVGRPFVARVIARLRDDGVIATRRGTFRIVDEAGLRALSCSCTATISNHFDTVLHGIYPPG
ncbi:Crp/Fnr family transcriptional regulator [Zavarzinia sp. CC-PAN008]|uniref:Crp/Fnr family transcriptional regulator n=1 Tax=Zavarzinia sp. CC-PAN008 TaxID=3243332 RepID=UPI003F744754